MSVTADWPDAMIELFVATEQYKLTGACIVRMWIVRRRCSKTKPLAIFYVLTTFAGVCQLN
jgi:hypothetical protein